MYFLPLILAFGSFALYPSTLLSLALGVGSWLYLARFGEKPDPEVLRQIPGQLAYRVLSVKLLALNGPVDERAAEIHALATPDYVENAMLRARLRGAASAADDGWQDAARTIQAVYGSNPDDVVRKFGDLVAQITGQDCTPYVDGHYDLAPDTLERLGEIARMWRIGPARMNEALADNHVRIDAALQRRA